MTQNLGDHMQRKGQEVLRERQNVWRALDACETEKRQLNSHHARFARGAEPLEGPLAGGVPSQEVTAVVQKLQRAAADLTAIDQQEIRARSELRDTERRARLFQMWLIVLAAVILLVSIYLLFFR
ncbi:hypothetical protein [Deinococcus aquaticus]|uniref:hypothetical protein n=1 Tax=Deinococcus aquaticus TaxID=328692 RepID=UPI003F478DBD